MTIAVTVAQASVVPAITSGAQVAVVVNTGGTSSSFNPASPGPIGGTTPGSAAFTTVSATGQITSTVATGTAPLVIASTTQVANLNASLLGGNAAAAFIQQSIATTKGDIIAATGSGAFARVGVGADGYVLTADATQASGMKWAAAASTFDPASPGPIGGTAPGSGAFTTVSATGQITSTVATGTAPLVIASTTQVANLNASQLGGNAAAAFAKVANNLSDLASASTARTNLGLGTVATQAASAVAITGGAIDGTAIGGSTPSTAAFSTISASSTLGVTGLATLTGGLTTPAQITSTIATGTPPLVVASTTQVANLNASQLGGNAASAFLLQSVATAKGDLIAATASGALARLAVGSNTFVLTADSTQASGMKWAAAASSFDPASPGAIGGTTPGTGKFTSLTDTGLTATRVPFSGTGGLLSDDSGFIFGVSGSFKRLTIGSGTDNPRLTFNSAATGGRIIEFNTNGLARWILGNVGASEPGSDAGSDFILTASNDAGTQIDAPLSIIRAAGGAMSTTRPFTAASFNGNTLPLATTKGDIFVATASGTLARLGVGSNTQVLTADSTQTTGVKWGAVTASTSFAIATKSTTYTATTSDYALLGDATSAAFTITLPAAASSTNAMLVIKKIDSSANAVTVKGNASEIIDGVNTKLLRAQYDAITVICNGTNWYVL